MIGDVSSYYVSSEPGCIAYNQNNPQPALTIVKEKAASSYEIPQPQWNSPDWVPGFYGSNATWVSDSSGVAGLLYVTQSDALGETLAWVSVENCVPGTPEALVEGHWHQSLGVPDVSTSGPTPWDH